MRNDVTVTLAIASRRGLCKMRRVEVCELWLQQKISGQRANIGRVGAAENLDDALSKYIQTKKLSTTCCVDNKRLQSEDTMEPPSTHQALELWLKSTLSGADYS